MPVDKENKLSVMLNLFQHPLNQKIDPVAHLPVGKQVQDDKPSQFLNSKF